MQLPSGVVLDAPQIGDGRNTGADYKTNWVDKVRSIEADAQTVKYVVTNGGYEDQSVHYESFDGLR